MSPAAGPSYMWPVHNVVRIVRLARSSDAATSAKLVVATPETAEPVTGTKAPLGSALSELVPRHCRLLTYLLLAVLAHWIVFPLEEARLAGGYAVHWVAPVVLRNVLLGWLCYGGWHWFLYDSPWGTRRNPALAAKKFNKADQYKPGTTNLMREMLLSTSGLLVSSWFECCMIRAWALQSSSGKVLTQPGNDALSQIGDWFDLANYVQPCYFVMTDRPFHSLLQLLLIAYWRDGHFYLVHRFMHPWRFNILGVDVGKFIYRHVHSLHHKSHNPGPWSGISMHPVEHWLYYTCVPLQAFAFGLHPIHMLYNKFHADISPLPGHDGHDAPGGGSAFHYLHHAHFECNYGTPMVPLDRLFGTYEDGSRWAKGAASAKKE